MDRAPTLILSPNYSEDSRDLWRAALDLGWGCHRLQSWRAPAELAQQAPLVFYGEPLFVASVAQQLGHVLLEAPLDWLAHLPPELLRRRVRAGTLEQVLGWPGRAFLKPADDKRFPAAVYDDPSRIPCLELLPSDSPLLWSEPVDFVLEVRAFVLHRQVATASAYARHGDRVYEPWAQTGERHDALAFLERTLGEERVPLPPAAVLDVGLLAQGGWAIIEANPAWGAGVYQCQATQVLPVLARACWPEGAVPPEDQRWVLPRELPE